ncbi:MAG: DnaD domain protein [Ruminococcaceae bacterium]|nr:DnaD domain protein [Oscillospiraceae bacterium]
MIVNSKTPCPAHGSFPIPERVADLLANGECPSTYLAVYIYALRQYQSGNQNISNDRIAEELKVSLIDVVNAFLFYSSQGLLKIHNFTSVDNGDFDIEFCFSAETGVSVPPFRPCYKSSEISRRLSENPRMSQMYKMVGQILGKTLSSADTELLYSFHDYYGLPIEVIIVLIEYYVSKDKRSMKFIEKEVGKWASAGVNTIKKAKAYIEKREAFLSYAGQVRSALGIQERRLSTRELTYINNWQNEFSMPLDMVKLAFEATVNQTGKLSFAYMNKILESWSQNGFRKPEDVSKKKIPTKDNRTGRYDFDALQRRTFEAVNTPTERKTENGI